MSVIAEGRRKKEEGEILRCLSFKLLSVLIFASTAISGVLPRV
ncbi:MULTISPECIES: hypothetical protein [unclassified Okeania]|nr:MULTISPECIES: hypothetical protein [unclassified Okeania]